MAVRPLAWIALLPLLLPLESRAKEFEESIPARPGGTLRVELDGGSVEVEGHDEDEVSVEARASGPGAGSVEFELRSEGPETRVSADRKGLIGSLFGAARVRVRVQVPHRYSVHIRTGGGSISLEDVRGEVEARTSGGPIEIDEVQGSVDLTTSGGSVEADDVDGDLRARTSGGEIRAEEITGRVEARTSGGPIRIYDVGGAVDLHTSGGGIDVRFTGTPEGRLETSGGSVEVEFPEDAAVDLDARTSGGRVEVEHGIEVFRGRVDPDRIEGKINGGGPLLRLRTSGGNIRVRVR